MFKGSGAYALPVDIVTGAFRGDGLAKGHGREVGGFNLDKSDFNYFAGSCQVGVASSRKTR